ncbi:MAG: monovalent cation/H+ antiporter subunit D family protein [Gammaproteobacteria bacterium]|nr:monovalent cation/H+ antiporter subunit D family protein [Gammaproteobacteria bacterium]
MIEQNLCLLLVVIPLIAAPVTAMLPAGRTPWLFTLTITWLCFVLSIWQLTIVLDGSTISYELGGWAPPWGIEYHIDALNAFVTLIVSGIAAITLPYALRTVENEIQRRDTSLFYAVFLLCFVGLLGIAQTGDVFNLFVFLEISSLSSYVLIGMGQRRRALTAAYQYLIMGSIGATFLLIGIGLIYAETGTLNMQDLHQRLQPILDHRTVHTGFIFLVVGIALKLALFPLHLWLPNAYKYAPSAISVFLSATATKVAVYVMLRIVFTVFSIDFLKITSTEFIFLMLGAFGVLVASTGAIFHYDIKRILAYSSIAQVSYMVLGMGFASTLGVTATVVHMFNHALMKGALFMAAGAIVLRIGSSKFENIYGIGRQMPWTFAAIFIAGLSLIGIPGTAGFISKWYFMLAALEQQAWLIALVILFGSLLSVVYMWKIFEALFFHRPTNTSPPVSEAPLSLLLPMWTLVLANIYFGINTDLTVSVAETAVRLLGITAYHE